MPCYWEFIRCYMEEDGSQEQADIILLCPPIEQKKEGYIFGLQYLMRMNSRLDWFVELINFPFDLITSIARYIAMQTSKIPQWRHILANQTLEEYQAINDRLSLAHTRLKEKIAMVHSSTDK
ncbi:hypothetical protein GEA64_15970 [Photorhabdus khanii]|uniref:DUF6708 domain-containing protein n=1 Tax=Photorhabdus khanii TaxID=1004150 RepID=A0A7C9KEX5_9GAMM|nr:hypothetical protein [Photorhabdus khanii]MQL49360.1 hypothetical protein [Photorhabdus khanii]